jgi:hypothetical protein
MTKKKPAEKVPGAIEELKDLLAPRFDVETDGRRLYLRRKERA